MAFKINNLMASNFFGSNSNSLTSLFDALNKSSKSTTGSDLLQYNTVNTSTYRKALRAYYQQEKNAATSSVEASNEKMTSLKAASTSLRESVADLNSADLYKKNENGEYKLDDIKTAVKSFVEDYNKMVDEAGKAESMEALRNGVWMVNTTDKNQNLLSNVGITVGSDNKLSFSEAKLNEGNVSSFKSAFLGQSSFGGRIGSKALTFENIAKRAIGNNTYNNSGKISDGTSSASKLNKDV